jgi:hypothetical protein
MTFYLLPLLATLLPALAITYSIHHSIVPVQIVAAYFQYPGSPWVGSNELSGMHANSVAFTFGYALSALVGPKGFLLYDPNHRNRSLGTGSGDPRQRALLLRGNRCRHRLRCSSAVLSVGTNNYGGWSYSIRWFVPLLPLLFFFLYPFFETYGPKRARNSACSYA